MLRILPETQSNAAAMTKWVPSVDFDEQQLEMQPDCDTTMSYYGRNIFSIPTSIPDENDDFLPPRNEVMFREQEITMVHKIKTTMYGDSLIGRRLTNNEIEDSDTLSYEITSMIRNAGMGPSVDGVLRSDKTIPPLLSDKPHSTRGFPLLYNEDYFKLKPRSKTSRSSESDSTGNSSLSDGQKDVKIAAKNTSSSPKESQPKEEKPIEKSPHRKKKTDRIFPSQRKSSTPRKGSSPLPVPRDNANTPILKISDTPKSRLACNFAALDTKPVSTAPVLSSDQLKAIRSNIVFLTPGELYRKKRQASEEVIVK